MTEFYREDELALSCLPDDVTHPRVRWCSLHCEDPLCPGVHRVGVLGLDVCGVERWIGVIGDTDRDSEPAWVEHLEDFDPGRVDGYVLAAAAFGLPWSAISHAQLRRQVTVIEGLSLWSAMEMTDQGHEGLLGLRRLCGSDIAAMPFLLAQLGRYRANEGGIRAREDWTP
jgi:hypothetical protein